MVKEAGGGERTGREVGWEEGGGVGRIVVLKRGAEQSNGWEGE